MLEVIALLAALAGDPAGGATVEAAPAEPATNFTMGVNPAARQKKQRYHPQTRKEGAAKVECLITAAGALSACTVVDETPPGLDFGRAALDLAALILVAPQSNDGSPSAGRRVLVPFHFRQPD